MVCQDVFGGGGGEVGAEKQKQRKRRRSPKVSESCGLRECKYLSILNAGYYDNEKMEISLQVFIFIGK